MGIPDGELTARVRAAQQRVRDEGWTGLVVSTEANFAYLTGLRFDALWSSATRSLLAVVPADGSLHLVLPGFVAGDARRLWPDALVTGYDAPPEDVTPLLLDILGGMGSGPIGFEIGAEARMGMTPKQWSDVAAAVGTKRIADGQDLMWSLRLSKSPYEIDCLRAAGHANAAAFRRVLPGRLAGSTERDVARRINAAAIDAGADGTGWVALTSGPDGYERFVGAPRERVIESGDMVWADLGVRVAGYWSDYCRAAVVGGPSARQSELQHAVVEATNAGIAAARPGVPVAEVAAAVRRRSDELGLASLGFGRLGHGIGLTATEPPSVAEWDDTVLAEGMVITIEPAVVDRSGLFCAEQVLVITDGDPEVLSTAPTGLATAS